MTGKKKKNKKKGNQEKHDDSTSTIEDVNQTIQNDSVSNAKVVIQDHDHAAVSEMNQHTDAPIKAISESFGVSESDVEQERSKNLEGNCEESQKVNMLEVEKDIWSQKVGNLEERTKYLQDQVGFCIKREEVLQEKINKLEVEKNIWSQKEGILEEKIKYLQEEVSSCIQREVSLEDKIGDLQSKNASFTLREDALEERLERMEELNQSFAVEKVMELKESRDSLEKENKHLAERISILESRIQQLETVASSFDSLKIHGEKERHKKEAEVSVEPDVLNEESKEAEVSLEPDVLNEESKEAEVSVEPDVLNEESATKVSEIHVEPEGEDFDDSSELCILESNGKALECFSVNGGEDFGSTGQLQQTRLLGFDDSGLSEDVVSVPLDDIVHGLIKPTDEQPVPISDAPLIGAPFRLVSFLTRYVSGADLVDRPKSRR